MYADHVAPKSKKVVNQNQVIPGRKADMKRNSDGAMVFRSDIMAVVSKFLIIGSEGGTYYASEKKLTVENCKRIQGALRTNGKEVVDLIVEVSDQGRAVKNDPAIFALALACACDNAETRKYAYRAVPQVLRIGTHLFTFMETVKRLRKSSAGLRKAIKRYYDNKDTDKLALDLLKYKSRNGWSHHDVMRLVRYNGFNTTDKSQFSRKEAIARQQVIKFAIKGELVEKGVVIPEIPKLIHGVLALDGAGKDEQLVAGIIQEFDIPRELIPTELLNSPVVWKALLQNMPLTALVRNLNKMTALGLFNNFSEELKLAVSTLKNEVQIQKSRIHPFTILMAKFQYEKGRGEKGSLTWQPNAKILEALEEAYELAFKYAEPTGLNFMISWDVSPSMDSEVQGTPITARQASAALSSCIVKTEENVLVNKFSGSRGWGSAGDVFPVKVNKRSSLNEFMRAANDTNGWGGTNCSLPIIHATQTKTKIDVFMIFTDNETNSGHSGNAAQLLKEYRKKVNPNAKMIVCGMTATDCTIADPNDPGMLDIAGFDSNLPKIVSEFVRGW